MEYATEVVEDPDGSMDELPKVSIIVLNWNNYEDTYECLESLQNIEYSNYEIIVVDNGSTDGSAEKLKKEYPSCEFIFNEENLGYSSGMNVGIEKSMNGNNDYVLLLNNDTVVENDFLFPLVKTAEENEKVGVVSGVIYFADSGEIQSAGRDLNTKRLIAPHMRDIKSREAYEVECVSGAMVLLSIDFVEDVGKLNESYFLGPDDVDLSMRARKAGWKIMINPQSKIKHKQGSTGGSGNALKYYHYTKGRLDIASNHLPIRRRIIFFSYFIFYRFYHFVQWIRDGQWDLIHATLLAIYDHFLGKTSRKRFELPQG